MSSAYKLLIGLAAIACAILLSLVIQDRMGHRSNEVRSDIYFSCGPYGVRIDRNN